jgi:hypothetical protein
MRLLACVADVVRIAARKQDDIAVTRALDVRDAVDPQHDLAVINDVQGADAGEADRERPQRTVRNDPFSAQADALQHLREQVARRTIGKVFRRIGPSCHPFLRLRSIISK